MARAMQRRRAEAGRPEPEPDRSGWLNPFNDRQLLAYYRQIYYWHGFIRFLGLPHLKDNPDVPIDRLFVQPELTAGPAITRVGESSDENRVDLLKALKEHPRLVILGDPGAGKSTLVSWIAWNLSRSGKGLWAEALGPVVPLPMVVRELELGKAPSWDRLVNAFLAREVAHDLDRERLKDLLERGQALVLLDGVDEIASTSAREALREAVLEGVRRYSGCRWLITSRVVGYDRVPFHLDPEAEAEREPEVELAESLHPRRPHGEGRGKAGDTWADVLHVAPFSDRKIERFCHRWYRRYEAAESEAEKKAADLNRSLHGNARTLALARTPNLLTLMALIHRIQARLPHGRALLYGKIVDAYLESIDTYRGLQEVDYSLEEKRRWLAWVGFQMQRRRSEAEEEDSGSREILVDEEELVAWLRDAMAESPRAQDTAEPERAARAFVDYIARRSGLLLPRGQGRYAFTHLSFQEFFAALHLERKIKEPRWLDRRTTKTGDGPKNLLAYSDSETWREPLLLLFGLLAGDPAWSMELADLLFGRHYKNLFDKGLPFRPERARLLAEIATDPHVGLPGGRRRLAHERLWEWELGWQRSLKQEDMWSYRPWVAQALLGSDPKEMGSAWEAFCTVVDTSSFSDIKELNLGHTGVMDLRPIANLSSLESLNLRGTSVTDVSPLVALKKLHELDLRDTNVNDLSALERLDLRELALGSESGPVEMQDVGNISSIETLYLEGPGIRDISPISALRNLSHLWLWQTRVNDIIPLVGLSRLRSLALIRGVLSDGSQLAALRNLSSLSLQETQLSNLRPLAQLGRLQSLSLAGTSAEDWSPLEELPRLEELVLSDTNVADLKSIGELRTLKALFIVRTRVRDLGPLAGLTSLQTLSLGGTKVKDIQPLAELRNLKTLLVPGTDVKDVSPLGSLNNLEILNLAGTRVTDVSELAGLVNLKRLELWGTGVTDVSPLAGLDGLTIHGAPATPRKRGRSRPKRRAESPSR